MIEEENKIKYKIDLDLKKFVEMAYTVCEAIFLIVGIPTAILISAFFVAFKLFGFAVGFISLFSIGLLLISCWYKLLLEKVIE